MMDPLDRLKALMSSGSNQPLARPWSSDESLDTHISKLEQHLQHGAGSYAPRELQEEAVRRFWTSTHIESFRDAYLVSHGIVLPVGQQRLRVIEDRERFPVLLDAVDKYLPAPKQYRRCYQGLLKGYFAYDYEAKGTPEVGVKNWHSLRGYLAKRSGDVIEGPQNPQWAQKLQQHTDVLGPDPCAKYGPALLAGDTADVEDLRGVLGVPDSSWFMRKMYLAQVQAAVKKGDAEFVQLLYRLIELMQTNELIRDEGLTLVLNRFAKLRPPQLATPLRDAAVTWWGNPWLETNAMWRHPSVSPEAKAMVTEWLKLEFIEAFFTLLAEENTGDDRRLKFWARYVNTITDIRFALGSEAQTNTSPDFQKLRKKMAGLVVPLSDNVRSNNAFIMRMGPLVIVEFSGYSNACYGYDATKTLPFKLDMPVVLPVNSGNSLKHTPNALYLRHQDGVRGFQFWEERFEAELSEGYKIVPKASPNKQLVMTKPVPAPATTVSSVSRPAPTPVPQRTVQPPPATPTRPPTQPARTREEDATWDIASWKSTNYSRKALSQFADRYRLRIEDLTADNGNLWVRTDDTNLGVNEVLLRWGFEYKNARKGWFYRGAR